MLIILDKVTKQVKTREQNSNFLDGNIPIEEKADELYVRLHDNNPLILTILSTYDYELVLDESNNVTNVIVNKTLEQYQAEQLVEPQPPTAEERLSAIEDLLITLI